MFIRRYFIDYSKKVKAVSDFELQSFVPAWADGALFEKDGNYFFQKESTGNVTALTRNTAEIARLFDGQRTVREIIALHCKHVRRVEFRKVLHSIRVLAESAFLADSHAVVRFFKDPKAGDRIATQSPVPTLLSEQLFAPSFGTPSNILFWLLIVSATAAGIAAAAFAWPNELPHNWLKVGDSYMAGLIVLWFCHSFTLTLQAVLQSLAIRFATGITPGMNLQLTPMHVSLAVDEKYLHESLGKIKDSAILLFSVFSPVFIFGFVVQFLPLSHLRDHLAVLIPLYLLFYLDPYRRSPVTQYFQKLISQQSTADLLPFLKKRALISFKRKSDLKEEIVLVAFATFAILWSYAAYDLIIALTEKNFANLWLSIVHEGWTNRIAAGVLLALLAGMTVYIAIEIVSTLFLNLLQPMLSPLYRIGKKIRSKETAEFSPVEILDCFTKTVLFEGLNPQTLSQLSTAAKARRLAPSTRLIVQGEIGKKLYVILKGQMRIEKRTETGRTVTVARLSEGAAVGEACLTEQKLRTADVVAVGETVVALLDAEEFKRILSPEEFSDIAQKIMVSQYISMSELFKNLPREAASIFASRGKLKPYQQGSEILTQGNVGKEFYLLLRGRVEVNRDHVTLGELAEGNFFGEIAMVANVERTATIRALEPTVVLEISSDDFWEVLSQNIGLATYIEAIADLRIETTVRLHDKDRETLSHAN